MKPDADLAIFATFDNTWGVIEKIRWLKLMSENDPIAEITIRWDEETTIASGNEIVARSTHLWDDRWFFCCKNEPNERLALLLKIDINDNDYFF